MTEGTVKFFNSEKQFGFINGDDGKSYFVHATQLEPGTRITEGDRVSFTPANGERGPKAERVAKLTPHAKKPAAVQEEETEEAEEAEDAKEVKEDEEEIDEESGEPRDDESEEADEEKIGEDEGSPE